MKRILFLILIFISVSLFSQDNPNFHAVKTFQSGARYEIVQSELTRKITLKLDKITGATSLLVSTPNDGYTWQAIPRSKAPSDEYSKVYNNYQLFLGVIQPRDCFLINIYSGTTWVLVEDSSGNYSFQEFI